MKYFQGGLIRAAFLTVLLVVSCRGSSGGEGERDPIPRALSASPRAQDYYTPVDASTKETLRRTLHELIDDHKRFPYSSLTATDTWDILKKADQDPGNPDNILDLYRNTSIPKQDGGNSFYNREHSWPKSYGFPNNWVSNYPYTDCHALFLCDSGYNSSRSNKPYRTLSGDVAEKETEENAGDGGDTGDYPADSNWTQGAHETGGWETWSGRRGDVARALFYLDVRYEGGQHSNGKKEPDLILTDDVAKMAAGNTGNNEDVAHMGLLSVLLRWHTEDPVDAKERSRNQAVFGHQGNRNPFIDHPKWVAILHGQAPPQATVWINEIHYDNKGKDRDEFVEIAGPAGKELAGWKIYAYNGKNGRFYKFIILSEQIKDQSGGMGTKAFPLVGLQNGAPDGLVLVDEDDKVIEFLSYEGSFTATNGPVQGVTSTDIGVSEPDSTPAGKSLQRSGSGKLASDHTWQAPAAATRGMPNVGQTF